MDAKKIGLIAVVVLAIGLLAWSFKSNLMSGPRVVGPEEGQKMGEAMQEQYKKMEASSQGRTPSPAGQ